MHRRRPGHERRLRADRLTLSVRTSCRSRESRATASRPPGASGGMDSVLGRRLQPVQHDLERAPPQLRVDPVRRLDHTGERPEQHPDVFVDQLRPYGAGCLAPGRATAGRWPAARSASRSPSWSPDQSCHRHPAWRACSSPAPVKEDGQPVPRGPPRGRHARRHEVAQQLGDDLGQQAHPWWGSAGTRSRRRRLLAAPPRRCRLRRRTWRKPRQLPKESAHGWPPHRGAAAGAAAGRRHAGTPRGPGRRTQPRR